MNGARNRPLMRHCSRWLFKKFSVCKMSKKVEARGCQWKICFRIKTMLKTNRLGIGQCILQDTTLRQNQHTDPGLLGTSWLYGTDSWAWKVLQGFRIRTVTYDVNLSASTCLDMSLAHFAMYSQLMKGKNRPVRSWHEPKSSRVIHKSPLAIDFRQTQSTMCQDAV